MSIKNWTVTVETVKSVGAREVYFENKDEPSHADTISMERIWGNEATSMRIISLCEQAKAKQRAAKRGGRPPTPALEFVFVLPSDLEPKGSTDDWKNVTRDMIISLAKSVDVPPQQLAKVCRASLHREPQTTHEEVTKGTHVHLMVGKILPCSKPMPKLQQKKALYEVKQAFNSSVLKRLGHCHEIYQAKTKNNKKRFKNNWFKNNAELSRAVQAVQRSCTNLTKYILEENLKRMMSTNTRLNKALKQLDDLSQAEKLEEQQQSMVDLLHEQAQQVKEQAQQSIEIKRKRKSPKL